MTDAHFLISLHTYRAINLSRTRHAIIAPLSLMTLHDHEGTENYEQHAQALDRYTGHT